jgi:hypothetical protein
MDVYQKSATALIEAIKDLTAQGYECYTPMRAYSPTDLIATKQSQTVRLQVKYRDARDGVVDVKIQCTVRAMLYGPTSEYDTIDGWAVFCPTLGKVVYVHKDEVDLGMKNFGFTLTNDRLNRKLYSEYKHITEWKS